VRVRRVSEGVLLEPLISDTTKWFEELDRLNTESFPVSDRNQPIAPKRKVFN